jgi:DNA-binding response OmpR family regulator
MCQRVTLHRLRARPSGLNPTRPRGTVLLIDEDAWIRSLLADFLIDQGFCVEQATDSSTGLRTAEQIQPDIILVDVALPMRAGLEVICRLKQGAPTRDIPIIIVSDYAMLLVSDDVARRDRLVHERVNSKALLNQVNRLVRQAHPRFGLLPPTA